MSGFSPDCDGWYLPKCESGHNHEPDMGTKRRTACTSAITWFVNCKYCGLSGLIDGPISQIRWEQPYFLFP